MTQDNDRAKSKGKAKSAKGSSGKASSGKSSRRAVARRDGPSTGFKNSGNANDPLNGSL
jgi:hypothetical protein